MAIVGVPGWIGESAAQETGQRWMYQAGQAVRLTPPFWMSQMAGQSVYNLTVTIAERWYNNVRIRGAWRHGAANWTNVDHNGTVTGNYNGAAIGTFGITQGMPNAYQLSLLNGPAKNFTVTMDDGGVFQFNDTGVYKDSYRNYQVTNLTGFYDYLNGRVGQTRMGLLS